MPLQKGAKPVSPGFKSNIRAEVNSGKPINQAIAIAFSEARQKKGSSKNHNRSNKK